MNMTQRTRQRGFGLLEVVISSGILALVVGATTGLVRSSLRRTVLAADRSIAMNLAQEGIEQVRSARDSTFIDANPSTGWDAYLPIGCDVKLSDPVDAGCSWKFTQPTGSSGWVKSRGIEDPVPDMGSQKFTREIYITKAVGFVSNTGIQTTTPITDDDVVRRIHVIVRWDNGNQAVESATYLTNWRSGI